eukprot:TRINITY_DN55523_c0_g1_i1.p1 TRINITY_DN55523_c0_g1~~TRINITY_DN55523_c0_g1_i1.p1  ORF type:complete len:411 (+),score=129.32 TRINITY_DN55523_c0_g1_i1:96-1328(+)
MAGSAKSVPFSISAARASPFAKKESHERLRQTVREFMDREVAPHLDEWEEQGEMPRDLHRKAAAAGFYALDIPPELGGTPLPDLDPFHNAVVNEEMVRCGSTGFPAGLMIHTVGVAAIVKHGTDEMRQRVVPPVARGEKLICLCLTEPQTSGSDLGNLGTTAVRDGDFYVVNGGKTLITGGCRADYFTVAVRTGKKGFGGLSLLLLERGMPGLKTQKLRKMGWHCSDTASVSFDNVRVPARNLIGKEGRGFQYLMIGLNRERCGMACQAIAAARVCLEEAITYARQRRTFGKRLIANQGLQWKLMDVAREIETAQALHDVCLWALHEQECQTGRAEDPLLVARLCLLKVHATRAYEHAARVAVQVFGGKAFLQGGRAAKVERLYREVPPMKIGGGSEEIMYDLAGRQAKL